MRLRAKEVKFEKQDPSVFERPDGYEEVNFDQMDAALRELSNSFSGED
jgi:hypothetical protein